MPEKDGWGQPYQFAVNSELRSAAVLSIRSPGKDGEFDTDDYVKGSFDVEAYDNDVVWMDGYMGRWPAQRRAAPAK